LIVDLITLPQYSLTVYKLDTHYAAIIKPSEEMPKGRIIEYIDEKNVIYDDIYTEEKVKEIIGEL
jgi:hypothetical protein